jgi:NADH-quinone oxidoreductase subunit J
MGTKRGTVFMGLDDLFFYVFALVTILSSVMVVSSRNPVHAVLFLILAFVNAAGLFLLLGAEFLAMLLVIVYVGAVAVLFLFVVMMLDVNFAELRAGFARYLPIGGLVGIVLLVELVLVALAWKPAKNVTVSQAMSLGADPSSNTKLLGSVLYTDYVFFFEMAGIVLLIAMIGAIVLTLQHRENVKRQNIGEQVRRDPQTAIEVKKVEVGKGIL